MPFVPGQSGNPSGAKREQKFRAALDRAVAQDDGKRLRAAAEKLIDLASEGEAWAVKELADRLDGKAVQAVEASGPEGAGIPLSINVRFPDS
jgi:hypothetical protein